MRNTWKVFWLGAAASATVMAADAPVPGPGWTGLSKPKELIHARLELMEHMEILMQPIDTIQVQPVRDADQLRTNAEVVGAMLTAVPHLFPPTTNLYDPKAVEPVTIALPAIWRNFDAFYQLAMNASKAAEEMGGAQGDAALRAASRKLRASCDACHTLFLRPYEPPKVLPSDYQFDFSSAFPKRK